MRRGEREERGRGRVGQEEDGKRTCPSK